MTIPRGAQVHFRTYFNFRSDRGEPLPIDEIIGIVRRWLARRVDDGARLNGKWLRQGGKWSHPTYARTQIETKGLEATTGDGSLAAWAMEFQHPDAAHPFRQWATEVGVEALGSGELRINVATSHWIFGSYIGVELPDPEPSSPKLVSDILSLAGRSAFAASERLLTVPSIAAPGDGKRLIARIESPDRRVPLVYVALPYGATTPSINVNRLATLVAGAASVVVAGNSDLDKELEWLLPRNWRCWNGMVRVYQPRPDLKSDFDSRRHRFFTINDVQAQGSDATLIMIVRGIVRRSSVTSEGAILSIADIDQRSRDERLRVLRSTVQDVPTKDEVQLLWDEIAMLQKAEKASRERIDEMQLEHYVRIEEVETERDSAGGQVRYWKGQADELRANVDSLEAQATALANLNTLPTSLREVCVRIESFHPDRLHFTDAALASAMKAGFDDVAQSWALLWALATILAPLYLDHQLSPEQIRSSFEAQSGFDLALTEGRATNRDKKLMAKRQILVDGVEYDISPHAKTRDAVNFLRVHFAVDHQRHRLLIGHCGDHMDTAGTRRRR
jgi:hypothetical protein